MSKTLKKVALIVGIAAITIATFGVGSTIFATVAATSTGEAAAAFSFLGMGVGTLATVGLGLVAAGLAPTPSLETTGANARNRAFVDPNALAAYVFGTTAVPLSLVFEQIYGASKEYAATVFAHAWHRINSYQSLAVQGEAVTFSGENAQGDYAGILTWKQKLGAPGQTAIALANTSWPSTAAFAGVAHSSLIWNFKDQSKLTGGIPTQLSMVVEGALMYDPRLDSTVGGSGTQRLDDPTTWAYPATNPGNAVLVLLRYLIGEYDANGKLVWGRGAGYADFVMDTFISMANVADESRDGTFRFALAGMWLLNGDLDAFVNQWKRETGGRLNKPGGLYSVWLPHNDLVPLTTLTDSDVLQKAAIQHTVAGGVDQLYNIGYGRYIEPTQGHQGFPYPQVEESAAITADGGERALTQDFSWVQEVSIAQRIVRYKIRRSRFQRIWLFPIGWKGHSPNYAEGTVHTLNCKETGNTDQIVRVIDRKRSMNGATLLTLQEEDASIYDDTIALGTPYAANSSPSRLDRLATVTPRYIDGTSVDTLRPSEVGSDVTANNPQPASWLSTLILSGQINASSVEAVLNVLNMINAPAEAGADSTAGNPQAASWLSTLITSSEINPSSVEAALDVLSMINAPAEAGADQTALNKSLSVLVSDTRSSNYLPSHYRALGTGTYAEFKTQTTISGPGAGTYVLCFTDVPYADTTGGVIRQWYVDNNHDYYTRLGASNDASWGGWIKTEGGADITANNGQPPSWLTALIGGSDVSASSLEGVLDALSLINAPAEAGADVTANNGQAPSWLTGLIGGSDVSPSSLEGVLDALALVNAPAEAGADVTANNGQTPSWLTALIGGSNVSASSLEGVLDTLNLINAPAESGADRTADHLTTTGSFSVLMGGVSGTPSVTVYWQKTGDKVSLVFGSQTGAISSTGGFYFVIPTGRGIRPTRTQYKAMWIYNSQSPGSRCLALVEIDTTGTTYINPITNQSGWLAKGNFNSGYTVGFVAGMQVQYTVD